MLVDNVVIDVYGGHGGAGKASFFKHETGPDGGNGGRGGDLYMATTTDLMALNRYSGKKLFNAGQGENGGSGRKTGEDGGDLTIYVPIGTGVTDVETEEIFSFSKPDDKILMAKGGLGGLGNSERKSARMTTPLYAQHGLPGHHRTLKLELKLIADYGLIGLPNAGKTSLLNALTKALAKVADYPFTTLEPNLGVYNNKIIADIPGLIEGASTGKGLGFKFLKHIEKVGTLLHCLSCQSVDPVHDYQTIREELGKYNPELLVKKELIILTKTDEADSKSLKATILKLKKFKKDIYPVSILDDDSLKNLPLA